MAQINKANEYFNTKLYTGNGSTQSISGVNFQPDFIWFKERSSTSGNQLRDSVRGASKVLSSNATDAELTNTNLTSFDSDGFTLGVTNGINESGQTYASWNWLAGGTASSNTDGTITSSVSANTTSGFSVVTWTGAGSTGTVGHGLGAVPKFIITKKRNNTGNWGCYHASLGSTEYLYLNSSNASATYSGLWNDTNPTSSVISLGTDDNVTGSGDDIVAYCFAEKAGFNRMGSYIGNKNADGAFVYTGFKPSMVIIKNTVRTDQSWIIQDNKRNSYNGLYNFLLPNSSNAEASGSSVGIDFLSNGFKLRGSDDSTNDDVKMIYMCFAESPLVGTNGVPATAR